MKRIIIDSDTASDDAVGLILALREPAVKVEAITVVAGNLPVTGAARNARLAVDIAGSYRPPVYLGMDRPLLRDPFPAEQEHGQDGLSGMAVSAPAWPVQAEHAVDALVRLAGHNPGQLELVTIGPLTNVAMACLKAPEAMAGLKRITIMAGAGLGPGNVTPTAEYNAYVDPEALSIVLGAGIPVLLVGWDASQGPAFLSLDELEQLEKSGSPAAVFCVRANQALLEYNRRQWGRDGIDLPDPVAVATAIYPEIVLEMIEAYTYVETKSETSAGQVVIDVMNVLGKPANTVVCRKIDGEAFKHRLFRALLER
jgi:purine nucleosidase